MELEEEKKRATKRYIQQVEKISDEATQRFKEISARLAFSANPREELIDLLEMISDGYYDLSLAAAEAYLDDLKTMGERLTYTPAPPPQRDYLDKLVGREFGKVGYEIPKVLKGLTKEIPQLVAHAAHKTLEQVGSAPSRGGKKEKWARVPKGKTCAWCTLIASRGYTYSSWVSAGAYSPEGDGCRWHKKCDCQVISNHNPHDPRLTNYNPEHLHKHVALAVKVIEDREKAADDGAIAEEMRALFPDLVKDAHKVKGSSQDRTLFAGQYAAERRRRAQLLMAMPEKQWEGKLLPPRELPEAPENWPEDLPKFTAECLNHVLYGNRKKGGHLYGHSWARESPGDEFSKEWDQKRILEAAEHVLRARSLASALEDRGVTGTFEGLIIRVGLGPDKRGEMQVATVFPVGGRGRIHS